MLEKLPQTLQEIEEQAEREAKNLRLLHQLGIRGIKDIFQFIEKTLGYLLVRYPFGENSMQGFAAVHTGEPLIVTNSSERLGREIFTAGHELGHHVFDIRKDRPKLIYDNKTGIFDRLNLIEYRADCFAANFLMPKEGIEAAVKELGKKSNEINYFDVIQIQTEFSVSYSAMVRRLKELGFIGPEKASELYNYYNNLGVNLTSLFNQIDIEPTLLERQNIVKVPVKYLEYLKSNYENGYIPFSVVEKVLAQINKTPEELGFVQKEVIHHEEDDSDIDELLGDLDW